MIKLLSFQTLQQTALHTKIFSINSPRLYYARGVLYRLRRASGSDINVDVADSVKAKGNLNFVSADTKNIIILITLFT